MTGYNRVRPWVRYWARTLDLIVFEFVLSKLSHLINSQAFDAIPSWVWGVIVLLAWIPIEAICLTTWSTTPGKWLMNTHVYHENGLPLLFEQALYRSFLVCMRGFAFGLPIVSLFVANDVYRDLLRFGITSYDRELKLMVWHRPIGFARICGSIAVIGILVMLTVMDMVLAMLKFLNSSTPNELTTNLMKLLF